MVCLCLCVLFLPPCFFFSLPVYVFQFPPPPPTTTTTTTFSTLSFPPSLNSGSAGVHMIKHGTQVITWLCQIKRPLIQMRSEISKIGVAFAATTHPRRRQRGDLRAWGPAGRERLSLPFLQNITNGGNRAKHAQVHSSVFICITYPTCPLIARGILDGGCSATLTRGILLYCQTLLMCILSKGQRLKIPESDCALKPSQVERSCNVCGLLLYSFYFLDQRQMEE